MKTKVTRFLDCGCVKYPDGSRDWCPVCRADFEFKHPSQVEEPETVQVLHNYLESAKGDVSIAADHYDNREFEYAQPRVRLAQLKTLISIAESLERIAGAFPPETCMFDLPRVVDMQALIREVGYVAAALRERSLT